MSTVRVILERKGSNVATIGPEATALDAAHLMNDRGIGAVIVMDGSEVAGIVSERDIMRRVVAAEREAGKTKVREIMTSGVHACRCDTPIGTCREFITERRIRHLPVIEDGILMGIVTIGDIVKYELDDRESTIGHLHEYLYQGATPHG